MHTEYILSIAISLVSLNVCSNKLETKQAKQVNYNVTVRGVRVTIVAVVKQ